MLVAAWIGQVVGERVIGADVSGFVGALTMTPIALAIARLPDGPPSQVTALGSIVSIALGVLCGASIFRGLAAGPAGFRHFIPRLGSRSGQ